VTRAWSSFAKFTAPVRIFFGNVVPLTTLHSEKWARRLQRRAYIKNFGLTPGKRAQLPKVAEGWQKRQPEKLL